MPQSATLPSGGSAGGGLEALPTPVKIGLIGGGLGLAFFLWKRASSGTPAASSSGLVSGDSSTYGIPNTAVMLGSLQQEMLDLKGQQGADTANLSDLLTGGFENVGSLFDAQTATFQSGLTDLQNNVIGNQNTNTQSILDSLSARSDLLQQLIQSSSGAEQAAFQSFADSTAKGLGAIATQQNAEAAAIGALGSSLTTQQQGIISQLTSLQQTTSQLAQMQPTTAGPVYQLAPLNVQPLEVQQNYLRLNGNNYDRSNAAFLSDYSTNPYHGGYITGQHQWAPLAFWDSTKQ